MEGVHGVKGTRGCEAQIVAWSHFAVGRKSVGEEGRGESNRGLALYHRISDAALARAALRRNRPAQPPELLRNGRGQSSKQSYEEGRGSAMLQGERWLRLLPKHSRGVRQAQDDKGAS